jgi:hypothetical protein
MRNLGARHRRQPRSRVLDWLENSADRSVEGNGGSAWLIAELEARKSDADNVLEKDIDGRFTKLEQARACARVVP